MAQNDTFIIRAAHAGDTSIYRDIEIDPSKSLYQLAEAIVSAFGFDFDHAFGFYSGEPFTSKRKHPYFELFADMGEADGALSVRKTKIADAFPAVGHAMLFLFDYGDEWRFYVKMKATGIKLPNTRYPRIVASQGEAPEQYPEPNDEPGNGPRYMIDLTTGEKKKIG
jgi:hypothetical protein